MKKQARLVLLLFLVICLFQKRSYSQETGSCAFIQGHQSNDKVRCGRIEVPENHDKPEGKKIEIAYAVLKSDKTDPEAYPMIYLAGGPGGKSLTAGSLYAWMQSPILRHRDIILVDQRGVGHSSPLPDMGDGIFEIMASNFSVEDELEMMRKLVANTKAKASQSGAKLENYNTVQNARDIAVLMDKLGYEKYNLFGASYGTRLARVFQSMFPNYLNSVIHNSPAPMRGDWIINRMNSYNLALGRIFEYCENDPESKARYPNLKADYLSAIYALKEKPIEVPVPGKTFYINPQDGIYLIRRFLYRNDARIRVPELIMALKNGRGEIIDNVVNYEHQFGGAISFSMLLAIERTEMFRPENTQEVIDAYYDKLPLMPAHIGVLNSLRIAASNFHSISLPEKERAFKTSAVPTMITVNYYDPVTPPRNGYIFKEQLTNAQLFVLDEGGHGGGNPACMAKVMNDFMTKPEGKLDYGCLNLYQGEDKN